MRDQEFTLQGREKILANDHLSRQELGFIVPIAYNGNKGISDDGAGYDSTSDLQRKGEY